MAQGTRYSIFPQFSIKIHGKKGGEYRSESRDLRNSFMQPFEDVSPTKDGDFRYHVSFQGCEPTKNVHIVVFFFGGVPYRTA